MTPPTVIPKHQSARELEARLDEIVRQGRIRPSVKKQLMDANGASLAGDKTDPKKRRVRHYYGVQRPDSFDPNQWKNDMEKADLEAITSNPDCIRAMKFFGYDINNV